MEETWKLTCIRCTTNCVMTVTVINGAVRGIAGNACQCGEDYALFCVEAD